MKLTEKLMTTSTAIYDGSAMIGQLDSYPQFGFVNALLGVDKIGQYPSYEEAFEALQRKYRKTQVTFERGAIIYDVLSLNKHIGSVQKVFRGDTVTYRAMSMDNKEIGIYNEMDEAVTAVMDYYDENSNHS